MSFVFVVLKYWHVQYIIHSINPKREFSLIFTTEESNLFAYLYIQRILYNDLLCI